METVRNLAQLDVQLRKIAEAVAGAPSDAAVRAVFDGFSMDFKEFYKELPQDPFSDAYFAFQMKMYDGLAGKPYETKNEVSHLDVAASIRCPFPYNTRSNTTAGLHLSSLGFVIGGMKLPPGSSVIEFGAGWGNTTLTLALLGHKVTVVEIEPRFCELIRERAKLHGVSIEVINADFLSCESMTQQFDAALFYECFHHCSEHLRLLRALHRVVKATGTLYLGAEPITPDFPVPWGLRLDGESLWAIRQNGWMELGYREDYFKEALRRTGWVGASQRSVDCGFSNLWTLRPVVNASIRVSTADPAIASPIPKQPDGSVVIDAAATGYVLWGPYMDLAAGTWDAEVHLTEGSPRTGVIVADVSTDDGRSILAGREVNLSAPGLGNVISVPFVLKQPASRMEIRVYVKSPSELSIGAVVFSPRQVSLDNPPWIAPPGAQPGVPQAPPRWRSLSKRALLKLVSLVDR